MSTERWTPPGSIPARRKSAVLLRGKEISSSLTLPTQLNWELSPSAILVLSREHGARQALSILAATGTGENSSLLGSENGNPGFTYIPMTLESFTKIFEASTGNSRFLLPLQTNKEDVLFVPPIHLLIPFPEVLSCYLRTITPASLKSLLNAPIRIKQKREDLIDSCRAPMSPFVYALKGIFTSSAAILAKLGCRIELPALAFYIMNNPWNTNISEIVDEFKKAASEEKALWNETHPVYKANFFGMLAAVSKVERPISDPFSKKNLFALLDEFHLHNSNFAFEPDSEAREPFKLLVRHNHKILFEWFKQIIEGPVTFTSSFLARAMSEGNHECLETWVWRDGSQLVSFHEIQEFEWKAKKKTEMDNISRYIPPFNAGNQAFFSMGENFRTNYVEIYAAKYVHMAIRHVDTVKFLISKVGESPNAVLKYFDLQAKGRKGMITLLDMALSYHADETATYLLSLKDCTCSEHSIGERARYFRNEGANNPSPELINLIQAFARHPKCGPILMQHIPDLPLFLRYLKVPVEKFQSLFDGPTSILSVDRPVWNENKENLGTYLHIAMRTRDYDLLQMLLTKSPNLEFQEIGGMTVLHFAASMIQPESSSDLSNSKDNEILNLLLKNSHTIAAIDQPNLIGLTPLMLAMIKREISKNPSKNDSVVTKILNRYAEICNGEDSPRFNYWDPISGSILHNLACLFINVVENNNLYHPIELGLNPQHIKQIFEMFICKAEKDCEKGGGAKWLLKWNSNLETKENCTALDLIYLRGLHWESQKMYVQAQGFDQCVKSLETIGLRLSEIGVLKEIYSKHIAAEAAAATAAAVVPPAVAPNKRKDPRIAHLQPIVFVKEITSQEISPISAQDSISLQSPIQLDSIADQMHSQFAHKNIQDPDAYSQISTAITIPQALEQEIDFPKAHKQQFMEIPRHVLSALHSSSFETVKGYFERLTTLEAHSAIQSQNTSDCRIPLHYFADIQSIDFRRCRTDMPGDFLSNLEEMGQFLSDNIPEKINCFDINCLTPLATSILNDAKCNEPNNKLFQSSRKPPLKSVITTILENAGCSCSGFNKHGQTVIHGVVLKFLESCNMQQKSGNKGFLDQEEASAAIKAFIEYGVDINAEDDTNHTALDLLLAEAGPLFLASTSQDCEFKYAVDWNSSESSSFLDSQKAFIETMRFFGGKFGIELYVIRDTLSGESFYCNTTISGVDEIDDGNNSEYSAVIEETEAAGSKLEFNNLVYSCNIPAIQDYIKHLAPKNQDQLMHKRDEYGNLPIHTLALTPNSFRVHVNRATQEEKIKIQDLVKSVSDILEEDLRNSFNDNSMNAMALSILVDAHIDNLMVSASNPPEQSLMSALLEEMGFNLHTIDAEKRRNVIHGTVLTWLDHVKKGLYDEKTFAIESFSSAIKAYVIAGVDINFRDWNLHTPLDLLMESPGAPFLSPGFVGAENLINWFAPENAQLREIRDIFRDYLITMGAKTGGEIEIEHMKNGGKRRHIDFGDLKISKITKI